MSAGPGELERAAAEIRAGGVVAFPTETVYGLGADALNEQAVARVFALKGRPAFNPLIVHVRDVEMARRVVSSWPEVAQRAAEGFWPGPATLVLPKAGAVPGNVTAGLPTVAVRCPDHPRTLRFIELAGTPIVGPSANPSGRVSPTTAAHVRASFGDSVLVLEGGACREGIESTVVWLADEPFRVLRPGPTSGEQIAGVIGRPVLDASGGGSLEGAMVSPGLLTTHYAPRTPTELVEIIDGSARGRVVVISQRSVRAEPPAVLISMPEDARGYAAKLYAALREADELGAERIIVERPLPGAGGAWLWSAVLDRLKRACGRSDS